MNPQIKQTLLIKYVCKLLVCGCKGSELFWIEQIKITFGRFLFGVEGKGKEYLPDHWQKLDMWRRHERYSRGNPRALNLWRERAQE